MKIDRRSLLKLLGSAPLLAIPIAIEAKPQAQPRITATEILYRRGDLDQLRLNYAQHMTMLANPPMLLLDDGSFRIREITDDQLEIARMMKSSIERLEEKGI